jgi:NADH-quinone oxidoreductase subunit E
MLRRLYHEQPEHFAFTPGNQAWAQRIIAKYPEGREASAVIPLLWRAQEQEGWVTRPAIEEVARMLGMAYIRVLEIATFYFMFQLQPMGSVAHVQICGTTSCMICGAEDLMRVCREKIAPHPHEISADGKLSWEEVECLGACANAPMAQIGKDYYEDLTAEGFGDLIEALRRGEVPRPGPQDGRFGSEPVTGLTALTEGDRVEAANASVTIALELHDTVARITGDPAEPFRHGNARATRAPEIDLRETSDPAPAVTPRQPVSLSAPRDGRGDDLKLIKGVEPVLEDLLHRLGFWHFDQIGAWTPDEIAWVDGHLGEFNGRVEREGWVEQARQLAEVGETPHAQNEIRKSEDAEEEDR